MLNFSHEANLTIDELVKRIQEYYPDADFELLRKAYYFSEKCHHGQKRSSGEEYITHPLNVASTLIKLRLDMDSIIAGLLHDVVEDCDIDPEQIRASFSETIYNIVYGLTKISKIKFKTKEEDQAENFRKMVVAMAKDIRVIIVKLADRMHNMKTLQYVSESKQREKAQETLDIYVPLASRLGINSVKAELEDLCLRFLQPTIYYMLAEKVAMKKSEREKYIREVVEIIKEKLNEYNVKAEVKGRPKHFYSIFKKMNGRQVEIDNIHDMLAFRIIVNNITQCYKTLGIIHSAFTPVPGRFKDYIAIPKVNNYQSLHTTVIGPKAERLEIQIRTLEMDDIAETGVAAHWKYKEGISRRNQNLEWVQELLEFNRSVKNNSDFMDVVKNDLDAQSIFIFTPNGDVKELPVGSTPLDFAYAVHTEVGNLCIGAKSNGKIVPLRYRLKSGDVVEILTSKTQTPTKDWLKIVRTGRAKTKIKQWLLKIERNEHKRLGEELVERSLKGLQLSFIKLKKDNALEKIMKVFHLKVEDEIFVSIGSGKQKVADMFKVIPEYVEAEKIFGHKEASSQEEDILKTIASYVSPATKKQNKGDNAIVVQGLDDILVRFAKCCNPIPGDPIIGFITRGRGITIHTQTCKKKNESDNNRSIFVEWNTNVQLRHPVTIKVVTLDRPGILAQISNTIHNMGMNIRSAIARSLPDEKGNFIFEVEVRDNDELIRLITTIEKREEVIKVYRV